MRTSRLSCFRTSHHHGSHGMSASRALAIALIASLALITGNSSRAQETDFDPASFSLSTELIVDGLSNPVQMVDPDDGSGRMFIVQQTGQIVILRDGNIANEPFVDIGDR